MKVQYPSTTNFPVKFKHTEEEKIIPKQPKQTLRAPEVLNPRGESTIATR